MACFNDLVALGLLRALSDIGFRVPHDVSVVGRPETVTLAASLEVRATTAPYAA